MAWCSDVFGIFFVRAPFISTFIHQSKCWTGLRYYTPLAPYLSRNSFTSSTNLMMPHIQCRKQISRTWGMRWSTLLLTPSHHCSSLSQLRKISLYVYVCMGSTVNNGDPYCFIYYFSLLSSSVFLVFDMAHLQEGEKPLEQPVASLPQHLRLFEVGSHRGRSLQGKPSCHLNLSTSTHPDTEKIG